MIKSMTGFGAGDCENEEFKVHIELKSVNQRYLETNLHMHYSLALFENDIVRKIKEFLSRGKIDVNVSFQDKRDSNVVINVDKGLARAYYDALKEISDELGMPAVSSPTVIASYPDVMKVDQEAANLEAGREVLLNALEMALKNLVDMRIAEGQNIESDLLSRIDTLQEYADRLEELAPQLVEQYRQRLDKVMAEILPKGDVDENRIIQEVGMYADRINYTEEIVRLRSHFDQLNALLASDKPVGRKIDFLIQEMNREVNTVASKANSAGASQLVVDAKAEIEKVREQIQNIE